MAELTQHGDAGERAPLRLFYIRHGETEWSRSGQRTGRTELTLTAHGEDEARQLEPYLGGIRFSLVLTSPRERARQTCMLAGLEAQAATDPDLAEWDYGDYEGLRSVDIRKIRPDWNIFQDGCPNGETPTQISDRADRLIGRLRSLCGNVAVFSHGHFGGVLAARWIGLPVIHGQSFALNSGALSILASDPRHPEVTVLGLWNFTPHGLPGRDQRM